MDNKKLIELACKEMLMEIVKESENINKKLSFFQKTLLYDKIKEMDYKDILNLMTEQKEDKESMLAKTAKYAGAEVGGYYAGRSIIGGKPLKVFGKTLYKGRKQIKKGGKIIQKGQHLIFTGGTRGALTAVAALFLFRKLSDPCVRKHLGNKRAQMECKADACKVIIERIKSDLKECKTNECKARLEHTLSKYEKQYNKYLQHLNRVR